MALAVQALFAQAASLDAADNWEGATVLAQRCWAGVSWVLKRGSHTTASADKLLQSLLAVFTEKQLQRALAIVDQVRRCRSRWQPCTAR